MNINVEWNKIVTNAISTLVAVVFIGAATIVWKGATTVDDKVSANRADIEHLIDALSDKLSAYSTSHTQITNAIYDLYQKSATLEQKISIVNNPLIMLPTTPFRKESVIAEPSLSPPFKSNNAGDNSSQVKQSPPQEQSVRQDIKNSLKR